MSLDSSPSRFGECSLWSCLFEILRACARRGCRHCREFLCRICRSFFRPLCSPIKCQRPRCYHIASTVAKTSRPAAAPIFPPQHSYIAHHIATAKLGEVATGVIIHFRRAKARNIIETNCIYYKHFKLAGLVRFLRQCLISLNGPLSKPIHRAWGKEAAFPVPNRLLAVSLVCSCDKTGCEIRSPGSLISFSEPYCR